MSATGLVRLTLAIKNFERAVWNSIFGHFPPPEVLCLTATNHAHTVDERSNEKWSIKDIIGDGFLFAVPKTRRTIEKRLNRKFGYPEYVWKPLKTKENLRVCNTCGDHHQIGMLCATCYDRIRTETNEMQDKIQEELGLNPVEEDVIVLYEGEKLEQPDEFWKGKRVIEMKKPRPEWFSKNLLQKTTQQPATSTDVKPTELA